jgi:transposase
VERPQGRRLDGGASRPGEGAPAARLGGAEADRLVDPGAAAAACARRDTRGAGGVQGGLEAAVAQVKAAHPDRPVEVWAADEHRLGLKPIRRRVWAPVGQRPVALGHHRYQWLQVIAFVQPTSGETVWYLASRLSKPFFAELLAAFARQTGAGRERHIVLVLDNAGWHGPGGLAVPEGISLVFLPPYSPELQPAEHLWPLVDEPIVNRHFATLAELEAVIAERCRRLEAAAIRPHTDFHWWPRPTKLS